MEFRSASIRIHSSSSPTERSCSGALQAARGGPVRRLLTDVTVVASRIEVKVVDFDDRIFGELIEGDGGGLLLDIDCDYLRDRKGRLVSGSASTLAGLDGVVAPGGILRLSITATQG